MWVVGLLFIIGAWEAVKDGYRHLKGAEAKSRASRGGTGGRRYSGNHSRGSGGGTSSRHSDIGFWSSEAAHGFPRFRHGFATGWHRHQKIQDDRRREREQAKAEHLENRHGVVTEIRDYRERQRAARQKIDEVSAPPAETPDDQAEEAPPLPSEQGRKRHSERLPSPASGMAPVTVIRTGWPGESSESSGPPAGTPGNGADAPDGPASGGSPEGSPESNDSTPDDSDAKTPATEGEPVATTETTYTQDIEEANAIVSEAEQHLADLKARNWQDRMEALAGAGLDSDTLSRAADMNDSINDQIKAAEKTTENATAFRDGLVKTHGAGHEYHSGTEGGGAEKTYLADQ